MRLNIFIAKCGFCSRRKADALIKKGKVSVNGRPVAAPWFEVSEKDSVSAGGAPLTLKKHLYVIVNKPKGITTTLIDRHADGKITDLIPGKLGRLYPVGRLDRDSEGLIILTNDGALCHRLTHPRFEIEKEYTLWVKGIIGGAVIAKAKKGVMEKGELLKIKEGYADTVKAGKTKMKVIVSEGKKRHLRRLFASLGFPVLGIKRIRIADLKLGSLKKGAFKIMDKDVIYRLTSPGSCVNKL